jgi:predicted MFS family arabinose efflux permease
MGPAVVLGLSRFAYALLLPSMQSDLGWSYADAGTLNTANAAGYLAGALVAALVGRRFGDKVTFILGLLLTAIATGASGFSANFIVLLALRFTAGVSGSIAFVSGAGLTSAAAHGGSASRAPTLLGVYFAGAGMGVTASALAVPALLDTMSWQIGWVALGGLALLATIFAWAALSRITQPRHEIGSNRSDLSLRSFAYMLVSYGLYGAGYIAYATFIVAFLRSRLGFDSSSVTAFWTTLGVSAVVGAFAWGPLLGRLRGGHGASATISVVALGTALPLLWPTSEGVYLSAILFGSSFLAVVASVTSFVRRVTKPHAWTAAIGAMTVSFGLGQCVGPVLSGVIADGGNGIRSGLWLSVAILVAATFTAALQLEPASTHD